MLENNEKDPKGPKRTQKDKKKRTKKDQKRTKKGSKLKFGPFLVRFWSLLVLSGPFGSFLIFLILFDCF